MEDDIFMQIHSDGKHSKIVLYNKSADDRQKAKDLKALKRTKKDRQKAKREKRERSNKESHRRKRKEDE